jgi:hypothetical protein
MLGGNGLSDFFKSNAGKIILGVLAVIFAAGGVTGPMVAMDNTNEAQQAELDALATWQAEFDNEWALHLEAYNEFHDAFTDLNEAFSDYTELNDQNISEINAAIKVFDDWLTEFYNNDPDALGEWQQAVAIWTAFYNSKTNPQTGYPYGEYQEAIAKIWKAIAALQAQPPTIIYITESE